MSQVILEPAAELNDPVDPKDRFAYGWRYVVEVQPDGSEKSVQVPLTLEDILHPREEDFRLLSDPHTQDCVYLGCVFKAALSQTPSAHVLADCRVAWDAEGEYGHGPDVAVIFNVRAYKEWSTFNTVDEGTKPALIIEVTSPSTRSTDLVNKVEEYAEVGVPHYVIADARERRGYNRRVTLIDYHLSPNGDYVRREVNAEGRIWLPEVKLWLGVDAGRLVCFDVNGERRETYVELAVAREEAEQIAADQSLARVRAEHRTKIESQARAEAERRVSDAEQKASEAERRASEAERNATHERAAREALEARLKELEQRLQ